MPRQALTSALSLLLALAAGCATNGARPPGQAARSPADADLTRQVTAFVHRVHVHGVPYEEARQLDPRAIPILEELLADRREERYWPNIAVTLAIVGDASAGLRLVEFITRDEGGTLSPPAYAAKTGALMALGYLVNHTGDHQCLDFLLQSASPDYWANRGLRWKGPNESTAEGRNLQLATLAMLGLALSAHPEAVSALEAMQRPSGDARIQRMQQARSNTLSEALKASRAIAAEGLTEYYRKGGR